MRDGIENDPALRLALEQAEAAAPPDYPNWKRGMVAALIGGLIFAAIGGVLHTVFLVGTTVAARHAAVSGGTSGAASHLSSSLVTQLTVFFIAGALISGAVGAFRPPIRK